MTYLDAEKRVIDLINSGLYEVVTLEDVKRINSINVSNDNKEYIDETLEIYRKYLDLISSLPEKIKQGFLETLRKNEIKHNQKAEHENMFLLELYRTLDSSNSIDMGVSKLNKNHILTPNDLEELHDKIMEGTEEEGINLGYRTKDDKVVEGIEGGSRDIHFIPIRKEEIPEAMNLICKFINSEATKEEEIFLKPFNAHALIAILQAFPDGNTRLARLVHQLKIWDLSRKFNLTNINLPALYMSKSFLMMRRSYRENLRKIVIEKTDDAWNSWYRFSLNAVNEQLNFGISNLEEIKRRL